MINTKIRLIIFFAAKDGEALYSQQKEDWQLTWLRFRGSDHELLIAKFRVKLKETGKNIRSFSYDLNQIPYNKLHSGSDKYIQGITFDRQSA